MRLWDSRVLLIQCIFSVTCCSTASRPTLLIQKKKLPDPGAIKKQGITLVFGDTLTHEIAGEMGMNAVLLIPVLKVFMKPFGR